MASTNFSFSNTKTSIISYDLDDNDVFASEIAEASGGTLKTNISMKTDNSYKLPNTTLYCYLSREAAKSEFIKALKATYSNSTVSRLFIIEVDGKNGYIQDEY